MPSLILFGAAAFLVAILAVRQLTLRRSSSGLWKVPGPKGLPILGNTLQIPPNPRHQYMQWAKEFGEIYKVRLGWNDWYMLNSPEAVKEIMDKQSAVTSSRVPMPVASDVLSGGMRFLLMPYGPQWRNLRAISHRLLTPKVSDTFQASQEYEANQLLHDILTKNNPTTEFYMHVRRYTVSVMMTSTYGRRVPEWDCEDVREIYGLMKEFSEHAAPGRYLADAIPPIAEILPECLQWWRKAVLPYQKRQEMIWMRYWTSLKTQMETGLAPDCFVKQLIESDYENIGISEIQAAFLAGSMIEAGSETTSSALNSCILYLSAYPDVRVCAHEELDRVVGQNRSPGFDDAPQLPYIRSIVKEILRLRPVTNMGTPHYTTADTYYKGYVIPKGSVVAIQQYPIHYDSHLFPDPEQFKPERYLSHPHKSGIYAASPNPHRDHWAFGAGRRICSGMHLAENSLFITIAKILWAFDIVPPAGHKTDLTDDAYEPGANTLPKPFPTNFIPRSKGIESKIRSEWEDALETGYTLRDIKEDL